MGERGVGWVGTTGVKCDSVVISVAVQVPGVVPLPAVGAHAAGVPSAAVPFMNCTVPVGPGPPLVVPVTLAVSVTLPPEATVATLDVTTAVVAWVPEFALDVTVMAGEVAAA
jgi:hypothetical protein